MPADDDLVLVTGATGFIAHHVIQVLQREGYRVRGTVRSLKNENKLKSLRNLCPDAKYPLELVEADLTKDNGWDEATKGCKYCLHVASPFPNAPPQREEDVIVPAVEGTKRVLQACVNAKTIKRIVLTSSMLAVHGECKNDKGRIYTEEDWTDPTSDDTDAYTRSKVLAEKEAWNFVNSLKPEQKLEMASINPGLVLGPCIGGTVGTSLEIIDRMMSFISMPMVPRIYLPICDVRDVALAHVRAMTIPEAANNRHIIVSDHLWFRDMAKILKKEFKPLGYCISTLKAPYFLIYLFSFFDHSAKLLLPRLRQAPIYSNRRMREILDVKSRAMKDILLDTVCGLIECGVIKKTRRYKRMKGTRL